ncbi:MAG: tRNA threonylcarbamoyladenosine biosynthesis protein TsaE [Arcticibacterium sp.]|jgi:tRNA threonylcarbamoyladenosine biosynthesis protein TsaE
MIFKFFDTFAAWMEKILNDITLNKIPDVAKLILELASDIKILKFEGELGAGKTTLIKALCYECGIEQNVKSPTFSIVNVYENVEGLVINHFDCYRLENINEAYDFGMEEYLDSGDKCFIEWPQVIDDLLPKPHLLIEIKSSQNSDTRNITLKAIN